MDEIHDMIMGSCDTDSEDVVRVLQILDALNDKVNTIEHILVTHIRREAGNDENRG